MSERSEELKLKLISRIKRDTELLAELTPKDEKVIETFKELKERVSKKPKIPKYETGVEWLDRRTRGIEAGTYINLAGQSFSGKTTLALKILTNIAEYKKAALFSFEMYEDKLVKELPNLTINQEKNLLIIQKQYELYEMDGTIRSLSSQGIRFFVIDSRMKVKVSIEGQEYQKIAYLSNHISKLCQELGIIIILINQISEENLKTGRLSLKGSGDQVYDSDMMLFLIVQKDEKTKEEKRLCICDKDRDNKKKWTEDITEIQASVETHIYRDDIPEMAKI